MYDESSANDQLTETYAHFKSLCLDKSVKIQQNKIHSEKTMKVLVELHFLTERGNNLLEVSLSSDVTRISHWSFFSEDLFAQDKTFHALSVKESIGICLVGIWVVPRNNIRPLCLHKGFFDV